MPSSWLEWSRAKCRFGNAGRSIERFACLGDRVFAGRVDTGASGMKPLALLVIAALAFTGCETSRSFKDGSSLTIKITPSTEAQKEAVDRLADELNGFRK